MEPSTQAATLSGWPFDLGGFIQNPMRLPVQPKQMIGDDDAGGERGGAGTKSLAERNIVVDFERDRRQNIADIARPRPARCAR